MGLCDDYGGGSRERERLCVSGWEMGREKETERK